MKSTRRRRILVGCLTLVVLAGLAVALVLREEAPDDRSTGAYRLENGSLALVVPHEGRELRLRYPASGESRPLLPLPGEARYRLGESGVPTPPEEQPAEEVAFRLGAGGRPLGFVRSGGPAGAQAGERIELREERLEVRSDGFSLRAKLVLPPAGFAPPHAAAVIVHGSGKESAVDFFDEPYLLAPHGIATLVYDKRGTGGSDGSYTQNFHVLARDVIAAVEALRTRPDIDAGAIHLIGYSQGGWIAPLAASRSTGIRSLVIGYGPMVPIVDEDRWGYVYTLRKKGFGDDAIAAADRIHEALVAILDHHQDRWDELGRLLDEAEGEPWFDALGDSDSAVGFLSAKRWVPLWALRVYAWWMTRPIDGEPRADRLYDPVPVVAGLEMPSLWILGGDDHSMPTEWTIAELERLQQAGSPVEIEVYPDADHGIIRFAPAAVGGRRFIGYEPGYMTLIVDWLRRHSGLAP
ncbi:MAG TPA: alpha/beta fold hydrolase [Thermoanaerobaculia bacterium]|nr:alpha/beta fold hydrolase [Thermoanaerobaculia bacterium]